MNATIKHQQVLSTEKRLRWIPGKTNVIPEFIQIHAVTQHFNGASVANPEKYFCSGSIILLIQEKVGRMKVANDPLTLSNSAGQLSKRWVYPDLFSRLCLSNRELRYRYQLPLNARKLWQSDLDNVEDGCGGIQLVVDSERVFVPYRECQAKVSIKKPAQ